MVSGALSYSCRHDRCHGKRWADVRDLLIPTRRSDAASDDGDDAHDAESSPVSSGKAKRSQATLLVQLVIDEVELFHDANRVAYATIPASGHREIWPVASKSFRDYLAASTFGDTRPYREPVALRTL